MILITGGIVHLAAGRHDHPDPVAYLRADRPHNYLDVTRLRQDTGFEPRYDLERAVSGSAARLRTHGR
jgi:nucleoside-diphosphate-sugar epimerase